MTDLAERLLAEWDWLRGSVRWEDFGARMKVNQAYWEDIYYRARRAGDPRARRASDDLAAIPDPAAGLWDAVDQRRKRRTA